MGNLNCKSSRKSADSNHQFIETTESHNGDASCKSRAEIMSELLSFGYLRKQERRLNNLFIPQSIQQIIVTYAQIVDCKIYGIGSRDATLKWHRLLDIENVSEGTSFNDFYKNFKALIIIQRNNKITQIGGKNKTTLIPPEMQIICASSGAFNKYHAMVIDKHNTIYASGCNQFGKDAFGNHESYDIKDQNDYEVLVRIPSFLQDASDKIIDIKCGVQHCLFLTQYQNVYAVGQNAYGQLCTNGDTRKVAKLSITGIVSMDVGQNHNVFINNEDELLIYGQFDCSPFLDRDSIINYFRDNNIKFMIAKCGISHCLCVSTEGKVFVFGQNDFGQITSRSTYMQECIENNRIVLPVILNCYFNDAAIYKADCGAYHNMVVDKDNNLYCWGWNNYKQCSVTTSHKIVWIPHCVDKQKELQLPLASHIWSIIAYHDNSIIFVD